MKKLWTKFKEAKRSTQHFVVALISAFVAYLFGYTAATSTGDSCGLGFLNLLTAICFLALAITCAVCGGDQKSRGK